METHIHDKHCTLQMLRNVANLSWRWREYSLFSTMASIVSASPPYSVYHLFSCFHSSFSPSFSFLIPTLISSQPPSFFFRHLPSLSLAHFLHILLSSYFVLPHLFFLCLVIQFLSFLLSLTYISTAMATQTFSRKWMEHRLAHHVP